MVSHLNPGTWDALDSPKEILVVLEESDIDWLGDQACAAQIVLDLEKLVTVRGNCRHIGIAHNEILISEGVENGFLVGESFIR